MNYPRQSYIIGIASSPALLPHPQIRRSQEVLLCTNMSANNFCGTEKAWGRGYCRDASHFCALYIVCCLLSQFTTTAVWISLTATIWLLFIVYSHWAWASDMMDNVFPLAWHDPVTYNWLMAYILCVRIDLKAPGPLHGLYSCNFDSQSASESRPKKLKISRPQCYIPRKGCVLHLATPSPLAMVSFTEQKHKSCAVKQYCVQHVLL